MIQIACDRCRGQIKGPEPFNGPTLTIVDNDHGFFSCAIVIRIQTMHSESRVTELCQPCRDEIMRQVVAQLTKPAKP